MIILLWLVITAKRLKMLIYFKNLSIGDIFLCNGNTCIKKSKRTAELIEYKKIFYFENFNLCKVIQYNGFKEFKNSLLEYLK